MPAAASSALTLQTMPSLVARERRHDRDLAADEDRVEQVAPKADDAGDEAELRDALGDEQAAVDPATARPRRRRGRAGPATSSLLTTPRRTAAATSRALGVGDPQAALELRLGTPRRSSHSVIRLPPPWTSTTGRRRATAATSASTWHCSAIVVPPSLTTRISLTSCTRVFSIT